MRFSLTPRCAAPLSALEDPFGASASGADESWGAVVARERTWASEGTVVATIQGAPTAALRSISAAPGEGNQVHKGGATSDAEGRH